MFYNRQKAVPQFRPKPMLERSATADVFKNTLSHIPTVFGQLAYLASLRDPDSGIYRHHGLAAIFGRDESRRALADTHRQVFQQWLSLPLSEKAGELDQYLTGLEDPRAMVLAHWSRISTYRGYIPASAREGERELFFEEIQLLVELLRGRPGSL